MENEQYLSKQRSPRVDKTLAGLSTPIYGLFILGVLYTLYLAHQIILPIVLALLTSLLLSPLVSRMNTGLRVPRVVSSLILVLLVLAGIAGVSLAVATPALEWAGKAPEGISRLLVGDSELKRQISKVTESAQKVEDSVNVFSDGGGKKAASEPTTVVLQTESWRAQLMNKARNG
ncbi:MAG: AI-2E family transporter, partial [Marinobacter sp.]